MRRERFGIYCFSDEKTLFSPVRYRAGSGQTAGKLLYLGAWVQKVIVESQGAMPKTIPGLPSKFRPEIFGYTNLKEIDPNRPLNRCSDNVFVVLMPGFAPADMEVFQLRLEARYSEYMRKHNIELMCNDTSEDILEVRPNFAGVGINLNAAWKKLFRRS